MEIEIQKGLKDTRPKWLQWIDRILLFGLIIIVIQAQIHGKFIANTQTQIDTCLGVPTNCKGDETICRRIIEETTTKTENIKPILTENNQQIKKINFPSLKNYS